MRDRRRTDPRGTYARLAAAGAALSILSAGCGGAAPKSDQDQIRTVVNGFTAAASRHDGAAACEFETAALQAGPGCETTLQQPVIADTFKGLRIRRLEVKGAVATVTFVPSHQPMTLRKIKGHWLIDAA